LTGDDRFAPWRSWRASRDERPVSRQERKGRKETKIPVASELVSDVGVSGNDRRRPLGDLGVLCVMNGPSHAKSAKCTKIDRLTVASHLVCDVDVRRSRVEPKRRRQAPTLQGKGLGELRVMNGPSHAKSAKVAKNCNEENAGSESDVCRSSWRSWRPLRDERPFSRQERKVHKDRQAHCSVAPSVRRRRAAFACRTQTSETSSDATRERSWRPSRDERPVSRQERKGRKELQRGECGFRIRCL